MSLLRSWIESANAPEGDFPLNNLPYGVFDDGRGARCGVAIGDLVLDLGAMDAMSMLPAAGFQGSALNAFMEAGPGVWFRVRNTLTGLLSEGAGAQDQMRDLLYRRDAVAMRLPFRVTEYTDFYAGRHHATNVGTMFRGAEKALPENWLSIPIGYNGRASSVVVSGTPVTRPWGQVKGEGFDLPVFQPSHRFDFELELGAVVGRPSSGMISVADADEMIFGYVLLNDWSARDIQAWEYQPLGPFQSKAAATTISPWVVTRAALEPFRAKTPTRDRPLLPYLRETKPGLYDIDLEVKLATEDGAERTVTRTNYREMYYSAAQQLAHHASSGCPMRVGDLLGSGTISGADSDSRGSMLELSWGGKEPLDFDGQARTFLEDGDTVTFNGHTKGRGHRVGFGDCTGTVRPAVPLPDWAKEETT